eukprot:g9039.t1
MKRYSASRMLVKTRMIPIEIFKKIVVSNEELFGFSIVQKDAKSSHDTREGLKLSFGGKSTTLKPNPSSILDCAQSVKKFSISSGDKLIKSQMDTLIKKHRTEKPTSEQKFDLKIQLYRREGSGGLEIINWQWAKQSTKRRRPSNDRIIRGNLIVEGNVEIAGNVNVCGDIQGDTIFTSGADLAEFRPICNKTKQLFEEIGSPCGRVVVLTEENKYTVRFPKHPKECYEVSVVSTEAGVVLGKQNKEQFPYCAKIVAEGYAPVCFVGDVKENDFLIPSGRNDGTAKKWGKNENSLLIFAQAAKDGNKETRMVPARIFHRPYPRPARLYDATPEFDQLVQGVITKLKEEDKNAQLLVNKRCAMLKELSPKNYRELISDILKNALEGPDRRFTKFKKALHAEIQRVKSLANKSVPRSIKLRNYQNELVRRAEDRSRSIIVLPTGTGKTFVAAEVIYRRLKKKEDKVCIFLCTTKPLQMQQGNELREYISSYNATIHVVSRHSDSTDQHFLENSKHTLHVMTAGGFNNLVATEKLLNHIDLIVLDEIHHLECKKKKHPYNYIVEKWRRVDLLGLTATPAASITDDSTRKKFESLLKAFDTDDHGFLQVIKEKEDLNRFCVKTKFTKQCIAMDSTDKGCIKILEEFIADIEMDLEDNILEDNKSFQLVFPNIKDVYGYQVQVTAMATEVLEKLKRDQMAILYRSQLIFLSYLSEGLSLVKNLGHNYALAYILERGRKSIQTDGSDDCKKFIDDVEALLSKLKSAHSANPEYQHPKFMEMKKTILSCITQSKDCKVLIFATTRRVVMELSRKINSDPDFSSKNIRSDFLLGSSSNTHPGRPNGLKMSQEEQVQTMNDFKCGGINVLFATTIAEEGIDIIKCNLVIQYDVSASGKCLQQRAGRARAQNSAVHSIYYTDEFKEFDETKAFYKSVVELDRMNHQLQKRANLV